MTVPLVESPCPLGTASLSTVSSPARHSQTSPQSRKRTQGTETTAVATGMMVSPTKLSLTVLFGMRRASLASQKDLYTVLAFPQEWAYLDDLWGRIMITQQVVVFDLQSRKIMILCLDINISNFSLSILIFQYRYQYQYFRVVNFKIKSNMTNTLVF